MWTWKREWDDEYVETISKALNRKIFERNTTNVNRLTMKVLPNAYTPVTAHCAIILVSTYCIYYLKRKKSYVEFNMDIERK